MSAADARPHVLFMVPTLRGGGSERVMVSLIRSIDRRKFRVSLAVVDMTAAKFADEIPDDVAVIDLRSDRVRSAVWKILVTLWRLRPHTVFSTLGQLNLALAILRDLLPPGIRYVARESSVVSKLPGAYSVPRWWFWAYRKFYARLDIIVCQSLEMQHDLIEQFGIPGARTVVINNPVDIDRVRRLGELPPEAGAFEAGEGDIRLVAAGSLTPVKGFDVLIEALASCANRAFHLTILGEGPLLADLQRLASERGIASRVKFVGFRKNPYAFFARADAFVLSSRFEGFPNVVLEALACGTPVIAIPSPGGTREILETVGGCILAEACSAEALARALASFEKGRRIPRESLSKYSLDNIVPQFERVLLRPGCHEITQS